MEELLKKLQQEFDISEKEIAILESLKQKQMDAKQIAKETGIPLGRIYEHLNGLLKKRLIQRSSKKPFFYFIENFQNQVIEFTKYSVDQKVRAQEKIMSLMEGSCAPQVDLINSREQFMQARNIMITEAKHLKYICIHTTVPHILYPFDLKDYREV